MSPPVRIAILDVDGTLTRVTSPWQYLHERLGLWDSEGQPLLERYLSGALDYDGFCREDAALWNREGLSLERARAWLDEIPLRPGAAPLLAELARQGVTIALLSTGFVYLARRLLDAAGAPPARILANRLTLDQQGRIVPQLDVSADRAGPRSKAALAAALMQELGLRPAEALLAGDRDSDLDLLGPEAQAEHVTHDRDLTRLLARFAP